MRNSLPIILAITLLSLPATAKDRPPIIEIFTYSGSSTCGPQTEDEFHNADGSHKEGVEENHDHKQEQANITLENFKNIVNKNPDAIALNYYDNSFIPHEHDEFGNDIIDENAITEPVDQKLMQFFQDRNYLYYRNDDFLDDFTNFEMVIDGKYKTQGRRKNVVDTAINLGRIEQKIQPIKLAINGQNLQIELPKSNTGKDLQVILFGYQKNAYNGPNTVKTFKTLNNWNGEKMQETVPIDNKNLDGFAVLAQDQETAKIYAAGKVEK